MTEFVNFYLVPGLALGSIYALAAVGISMIFGILRFAHFAHGDLMTVGAYGALTAVWAFGLNPLLAIAFGMALAIAAALIVDRLCYEPLRKLQTIYTVIASFGIALVLRSLVQIVWGSQNEVYVEGARRPLVLFDTFRISALHLQAIILTAAIAVGLDLFLTRTRIGKSMRAVADDPDLAGIAGLDAERVIRWVWILGAALAAVAGVFAGLDANVHPSLGWNMQLSVFAAAILGGIGKPMGAMAGGMIIGLAEELSSYPWLTDAPLIDPSYKTALTFAIMIVLLIFRPQGLSKGRLL